MRRYAAWADVSSRSAVIGVAPMVNVKDEDPAALVVDAISDSVFTASGTPESFEGSVQWSADAMRFTS
jgi:hypothetical protein